MAIKVSNTTVIDDSRNITNAGTFTATSFVGGGSGITNLPPSSGVFQATASGSISDGNPVILNSDGTVSAVSGSGTQRSQTSMFTAFAHPSDDSNTRAYDIKSTYDDHNDRIVVSYDISNNSSSDHQHGFAVVGQINADKTVTWGTPVKYAATNVYEGRISYDSSANRVFITYSDASNSYAPMAVVGSVNPSNNSISFGTPATLKSGATSAYYNVSVFHPPTNRMVVISSADSKTRSIAVTVNSNNTFTINHDVELSSNSPSEEYSITYDPNNGFIYYGYRWLSYYFRLGNLYYDGTNDPDSQNISTVWYSTTSYGYGTKIAICPVTGNILYFYGGDTSVKSVNVKVLETFTSGGNLHFRDIRTPDLTYILNSTPAQYSFLGTVIESNCNLVTVNNTVVLSMLYGYCPKVLEVHYDSNTEEYLFSDMVELPDDNTQYIYNMGIATDGDDVVVTYSTNNSLNKRYVTYTPDTTSTNLTSSNFAGISLGNFSNGQTAGIQMQTAVDDAQSGLVPGNKYYVNFDGSLVSPEPGVPTPTVFVGPAITSSKIIIEG